MTFELAALKKALDAVREDPAFEPKNGVTYCNMAAFKLVQDLGFNYLWNGKRNRPMLANECVDYFEAHPEQFSKFYSPMYAADLALRGHLVFAALKDTPHGHIAPVYPDQELVTSGKWRAQVPKVSNVGAENKIMGLNFAFGDMPNFYLVI